MVEGMFGAGSLEVFDVSGRSVARLPLAGDRAFVRWNAHRAGAPAGVYFLRVVDVGGRVLSRPARLVLTP
jgi:hypothetical protein